MKGKIFLYGLTIIIFSFSCFMILPTLSYGFGSIGVALAITCGVAYLLEKLITKTANKLFPIIGGVALLYSIVWAFISSWGLYQSDAYRNLIGEVKIGEDISEHFTPISTEDIRIVDQAMAYRLGDKILGARPSLGSQVDIGRFSIQKVKGKLYWVAPLVHSGFFKWNKNKEGTPGYVMVSANNERDVKLVENVGKEAVRIKYQPQSYLFSNLARHIYFNGYMTQGFTDFTFEIDDEGKPFWVVTLYEKRIGFSGRDAVGVITVDVSSGAIKEYALIDAPLWIDRIQPAGFVADQLRDWGEYVKGYFNFSNEGKLAPTDGVSLVFGVDGKSYWYTGLTSVGADEGTVGFVLVDTRTKEAVWYKQSGATEEASRRSAMGKVQEKGFVASFPIAYNINGVPTYVMSLKDQAGLVKMIAMVSVQDYTTVGVGNNLKETLRDYKNALNSNGNALSSSSSAVSFAIETKVKRIKTDIRNGNTFYYLTLEGYENKIFIGSSLISNEMPITEVGDFVKVSYDDGGNELVDLSKFDNLNFDLQKTESQQEIEKYFAKVNQDRKL